VNGRIQHAVGRPGLDDLTEMHHRGDVRDLAHDAQVVRDEQVREVKLLLQPCEQVDDLRLHGHVKRARRLVAYHQRRRDRDRTGDGHTLALPTR